MKKERLEQLQRLLRIIVFIIIFVVAIEFFGKWGVVGILFYFLLWGLYKCYVFRDNLVLMVRNIETAIWKKPLDKGFWKKGELKNTKVKVVWGRKKNVKHKNRKINRANSMR